MLPFVTIYSDPFHWCILFEASCGSVRSSCVVKVWSSGIECLSCQSRIDQKWVLASKESNNVEYCLLKKSKLSLF